jgi:hypothetical protein
MTMDNNQDDNQPVPDEKAVNITESQSRDDKNEA